MTSPSLTGISACLFAAYRIWSDISSAARDRHRVRIRTAAATKLLRTTAGSRSA